MANAIDTGSAPAAAVASRPSSSMCLAPSWPSSPGWNMNATRPRSEPRRALSSLAAPASIATWVSWPHACMAPSTVLLNSRSVSSCIGRASMSPRRSTVGPGSSPSSTAITDDRDRAGGDGERQPVERLEHHRLRARQLVAELGLLVDPPPQVDRRRRAAPPPPPAHRPARRSWRRPYPGLRSLEDRRDDGLDHRGARWCRGRCGAGRRSPRRSWPGWPGRPCRWRGPRSRARGRGGRAWPWPSRRPRWRRPAGAPC